MRKPIVVLPLACLLWGCTNAPPHPPPQETQKAPVHRKPVDETRRFPLADQVKVELAEDHLLGKSFLPGGNLAEYKTKGKTYRQFLINAGDPGTGAGYLADFKNSLREPKFLAHIGGYFGTDGDQPVYVFQKDKWVAGFVGLSQERAEPLARQFAARLY